MNLPNRLTLLRILLIPLFVALALWQTPLMQLLAAVTFGLASLTDLLDGHIARSRNMITDFGKLMDPIADKLLVMSALLVLTSQGRTHVIAVILVLAREFVIMGIRMVAAGKGVVIAADKLGKLKTVLQLLAILALLLAPALAILPVLAALSTGLHIAGNVLLWMSALLSIWSCAAYVAHNKEVFG